MMSTNKLQGTIVRHVATSSCSSTHNPVKPKGSTVQVTSERSKLSFLKSNQLSLTRSKNSFVARMNSFTKARPKFDINDVGSPVSYEHKEHIDFKQIAINEDAPSGFAGLPERWESLLLSSGISRKEAMRNKSAVLGVIQTHLNDDDVFENPTKLKTEQELHQELLDAVEVTRVDPRKVFNKLKQVGTSPTGEIWQCTPKSSSSIGPLLGEKHSNSKMIRLAETTILRKRGTKKKQSMVSAVSRLTRGRAQYVACKICNVVTPAQVHEEIALHSLSKGHENIVEYLATFIFEDQIWMVMEWLSGESLTKILYRPALPQSPGSVPPGLQKFYKPRKSSNPWTDKFMAYVLRETLQGLLYLHNNFRLHRDIKSDSILWDGAGRVKLTNFGHAVSLSREQEKRRSKAGTNIWMAPELIEGKDYDAAIDIWSLGITLFELATGDPPLEDELPLRALFLIVVNPAPRLPSIVNGENPQWTFLCSHFVDACLHKDPNKRANVKALLMHPLIQQACTSHEFAKFALSRKYQKATKS